MGDGVIGRDAVLADLNRPAYANAIVPEWLPQLPDVQARLADATRPARVGDFGCGAGWIHQRARQGLPTPAAGRLRQRRGVHRGGEAQRGRTRRCRPGRLRGNRPVRPRGRLVTAVRRGVPVRVPARPAASGRGTGPHATIAQSTRDCHRDGGACGEHFTAPGDPEERFFAACSPLWCVPQGVVGPDPRPIGPLMRPDALRSLAAEAGFSDATVADIEHPFWRFYRLVP